MARLANLTCKIGSGATPRGGESAYLPSRDKYALVRSQNVFDRQFDAQKLAFISDEDARLLDNVELRIGDVLLNITGDGVTFARSCLVDPSILPARVNQHVVIIRCKEDLLAPGYLLSYLTHPQIKLYMESFNAGGSRRALTKGHIESFVVPLPPITEQRAIAKILCSFDDKIELNRRMNATLEAMAQALFKSWFVDFEPVKAKAAGRTPEGMDDETAALFPNEFQDSELGPIPQGWEVTPLSDLLNIAYGKNLPTSKLKDSGYPVFGGNGQIGYYDSYLYEQPQVLIACRGAASGKVNQSLPFSFVTNNSLILETNETTRVEFCFLKQFMRNSDLSGHVTGSAQPQVTIENIKSFKVLTPAREILRTFERQGQIFEKMILKNNHESLLLADIRDALLPKLISGQLRISAVEGLAEAVG